MKHSTKLLT